MKRTFSLVTLILLLFALILLITWPFTAKTPSPEGVQDDPEDSLVLRFGYNIPERSALHLAAARFKEEIERKTEGRVQIELYPNQTLGNDHQMLEMARQGELDLLLIPSAKLSAALPEMQYADLPFLLPAKQDMYAMLDGDPGRILLDKMNKINMVGVTFWGNGFKHFTANRPLQTPSDFIGLNIRIMKSRLLRDQFNLMGAEAVPIDFHEIRQALSDGVVDGQENPLVAIHNMGIYEVQTDLTLSGHAYLAYIFTISGKRFNQLPSHLQTLLLETARALTPWQREETERQEAEFLAQIAASGVHIHTLAGAERAQFQQRMQPLADRYESLIGPDILAYTHEYSTLAHPSENRWLIGVDTDLSAAAPQFGLEVKRGAQLAIEHFQQSHDNNPLDIEVITRDNRNLFGRTNRTLAAFTLMPRMLGIIMGTGPEIIQISSLPTKEHPPILNPWLAYSSLPEPDKQKINLMPSAYQLADRVVDELKRKGLTNIQLVSESTAWSKNLTFSIESESRRAGLIISSKVVLDPVHPLEAQLEKLTSPNAATLIILNSRLIDQSLEWYQQQPDTPMLISLLDWTVSASAPETFSMQSWQPQGSTTALIKSYTDRFGATPVSVSTVLQSYDASWMLLLNASGCKARVDTGIAQVFPGTANCEQLMKKHAANHQEDTGAFSLHLAPAYRRTDSMRAMP